MERIEKNTGCVAIMFCISVASNSAAASSPSSVAPSGAVTAGSVSSAVSFALTRTVSPKAGISTVAAASREDSLIFTEPETFTFVSTPSEIGTEISRSAEKPSASALTVPVTEKTGMVFSASSS